jgi:hypothetical protein
VRNYQEVLKSHIDNKQLIAEVFTIATSVAYRPLLFDIAKKAFHRGLNNEIIVSRPLTDLNQGEQIGELTESDQRLIKRRNRFAHREGNAVSDEERDLYETHPDIAILPLEFVKQLKANVILEPCAGNLAISNIYKERGYTVISKDIITSEFIETSTNFLTDDINEQYDVIIINPPFSKKLSFFKRCIELGKPFAILLPLQFAETKEGSVLFNKHVKLLQILSPVPQFYNKGVFKSVASCGWFYVYHLTNEPCRVNVIRWKEVDDMVGVKIEDVDVDHLTYGVENLDARLGEEEDDPDH